MEKDEKIVYISSALFEQLLFVAFYLERKESPTTFGGYPFRVFNSDKIEYYFKLSEYIDN